METFYLIVLSVAIILLIIILAYIGVYGMNEKSKSAFPPVKYDCPDYWQKNEYGECLIPTSGPNMGAFNNTSDLIPTQQNIPGINTSNNAIDFESTAWSASGSSRCAHKKWANDNGIVWDTVSNYNQC